MSIEIEIALRYWADTSCYNGQTHAKVNPLVDLGLPGLLRMEIVNSFPSTLLDTKADKHSLTSMNNAHFHGK